MSGLNAFLLVMLVLAIVLPFQETVYFHNRALSECYDQAIKEKSPGPFQACWKDLK